MRAVSATIALGFILTAGVAGAGNDSQCVQDAKEQRGQCRMACDDDFVVMRDVCRNIDPECAAGCRAAKAACRDPILTALASCVDQCEQQAQTDRASCPRRGRGRDFCVQQAQLRDFLCRDQCRETLHVHAGLDECRSTFSTCMSGCGLPGEPTPVPTASPVRTEHPPEPTVVPTEPPHPTEQPHPTVVATEHPPAPVKTSTPKPEPTQTAVVPR